MKKIIGTLSVFTALILILSSCSKVDKNAMLVPKDAAFAVHLNTNSLSKKLSWDEIKQTTWFSKMHRSAEDSLAQKLLDNPDNSGMKTDAGFAIFAKRATSQKGYFGVAGSIKDEAAFEAFNKKISNNAATTNANNLKSIRFDEKGVVSWNSEKFLYLMDVPFADFSRSFIPTMPDSTGENFDRPEPAPLDLQSIAGRIFNYKNDSLLVSDDRFSSLIKEDGDVHFWFNAEAAYGSGTSLGFMSMLKMDVYFKEAVTASTLKFDNGKINVHSRTYANKEMRELFKRYGGSNINTDLIKRIPSDNVLGVIAVNYKPEGLKELMKLGGFDGMLNQFLAEMKITFEDFIAANKGEMLLAVTDFSMKEKAISLGEGMDSFRTRVPDVNILFANAIGDRAAFDKLIAAGKAVTEREGTPPGVFYNVSNELFVVGNKQETIDAYLKGGSRDFNFISKINGHPFGMYLDLNKIIASASADVKDSTGRQIADASIQTWKDIVATGGEFKNDAMEANYEVNFVDQNTNSLKQLNAYVEKLASMNKRAF